MLTRRSSSCTASRRPARAGGGRPRRWRGRYRALVPDLPGHGQAAHRTPSFDACAAYVRALAPAAPSRSPATRWAAGSRSTPRSRSARRSSRGSCWSARARASPTRRSARQRRAADDALADRIETLDIEAFAREWGAQPLFAGQPERVAAARLRRPAAQHARRARGGAARPRDRRDGAAVGSPAGADDPGHADHRRARREVPRARRGRCSSGYRTRTHVTIPGAGHAAQLEDPARGRGRRSHQSGSPSSSASA